MQAAKASQQDKAQLDIISESIKELVWVELRQCRRLPTEGNLGKIAIESTTGKEKIEADINRSLNDDSFKFILENDYKQAAEDFYNMTQAIQESDHKKLEIY